MPLNPARLATALQPGIVAAFVASGAVPGPALNALAANLATTIAGAVIAELANATVLPVALVAPPGGGPVTGVGSVT